ncbi:MAG: DUF4190 domain-containing protein [Pyrinomonadaceae bacterium]
MKKCPICEKTYDDSLRFCQSDGSALISADEPIDPFKTMVARPADTSAPEPSKMESSPEKTPATEDPKNVDALKTMYASEDEIRKEMELGSGGGEKDAPFIEGSRPEPLPFENADPAPPVFGSPSPGSTPFSSQPRSTGLEPPASKAVPPIPSPFNEPMTPSKLPDFKDADPRFREAAPSSIDPLAGASQWTPPLEATAPWEGQSGQGDAINPPPVAGGGPNSTLAMVSLGLGILSLPCCGFFVVGIAAMITGFMAKNKASNSPSQYGGRGMALAGIALGALTIVIGILMNLLVWLGIIPIPNIG